MQTAVLAFLLAATAADAQAPPSPANSQTLPLPQGTVRCAPMPPQPQNSGQGERRFYSGTVGQAPGGLSDRLAQSDGVLCPPSEVDSQMHKDAPDEGNTPVIPPPGAPGGDPSIRRK